jgi:hypothetical protein
MRDDDDDEDDDDLFSFKGPPPGDGGRARHTDPDTSHGAASEKTVSKLEDLYLRALRFHAPHLTTTEIANVYDMDRDSFSPRSRPLIERGLVVRDGKRLCANSAGKLRLMLAFRLTEKGIALFSTEAPKQ